MPTNRLTLSMQAQKDASSSAENGYRSTPKASDSDGDGPQELVDALHLAFGIHRARAVHAKGIVLEGVFTPTLDARSLCRARIFDGVAIPVTVRFSDFTGLPNISDTTPGASPRGFAVRFRSETWDGNGHCRT